MRPLGRKCPDNDVIHHAPKVSNGKNTNAIKGLAVAEMRKSSDLASAKRLFMKYAQLINLKGI